LDDNLDEEGSDNQHSAKWEDAQDKLQSAAQDPSQYHPAVSCLSPPPVNTPLTPSNANSQLANPMINHPTVVNSNITSVLRPLLRNMDDNSNIGIMNSYDTKENKRN
jgi:hypothetical protein